MVQSTYTAAPKTAYPGQLEGDENEMTDCVVDETTSFPFEPGLVIMRDSGGDKVGTVPPATAVDDDAIMTALATAASTQTLDTEFDGVIALGRISPPSKITITRSSHVDQDAVTIVVTGLDENGLPVTENLAAANGGNETLTTTLYYSRVTSVVIPAQSGTGGTTKIGVSAPSGRTLDGGDVLGMSVRTQKALLDPSSSNNENYADGEIAPLLTHGLMRVACETTFRAGDIPCVRVVATAGVEKLGAIRAHDTDSGDCIPWRRARILNSGAGASGEMALLRVKLI